MGWGYFSSSSVFVLLHVAVLHQKSERGSNFLTVESHEVWLDVKLIDLMVESQKKDFKHIKVSTFLRLAILNQEQEQQQAGDAKVQTQLRCSCSRHAARPEVMRVRSRRRFAVTPPHAVQSQKTDLAAEESLTSCSLCKRRQRSDELNDSRVSSPDNKSQWRRKRKKSM